ncbi:MAG: hypothetical protein K2X08_06705 [Chlamydiales bacterium]|nr:hypothetical protein [Chlamydiales bacterium]
MKNISFIPLLTVVFLSAMIDMFANVDQISLAQRLFNRPNRIFFGPEFLSFQVNTNIKDIHINRNRFFWGIRVGYEYLKPQAFYASAEILATNADHNFAVTNSTLTYNGSGGAGFGSIQTRFGYTLSVKQPILTTFLGLGVYSLSKHGHNGFKEGMGYISGGVRTQFEWTPICFVALNAEFFKTLGMKQIIQLGESKVTNRPNGWGCNIGTPLTLRISRGWEAQVTPYYLRQLFSQNQNIYGINLLFGYRF